MPDAPRYIENYRLFGTADTETDSGTDSCSEFDVKDTPAHWSPVELDRGSEGSALHCLDLRVRDRRAVATEAQTAAHVRQLGLKFTCAGWSLRPSAAVGARLGRRRQCQAAPLVVLHS